jgi:DNA-binding winged helix-turn-helix (wHTH) protein
LVKTAILFLMNNHGVELSKSAFCEAVWPGKKVYDSQYNQLVNRIKRELGDNTQNPNGLILQNRGTIQLVDGFLD